MNVSDRHGLGDRPSSLGKIFGRHPAARRLPSLALAALLFSATAALAQVAADTAVEVSGAVQAAPPKITLSWPAKTSASSIMVYRKAYSATAWGTAIATLAGTATGYADSAVSVGVSYEYRVAAIGGVYSEGYLAAGIQVPLVESRGKVILIVDSSFSTSLAAELDQLEEDLAGDGWVVIRHDVSRTDTVPFVKDLIVRDHARDPVNVKYVFLFGHVPVPYSGEIAPDGHGNHYGAWPADMFYGDMDGVWTDVGNYDSTVAGRQHNVAGDGKYDQSSAPGNIELGVGRVDLANMPAFAPKTETDLLRQYLNKDHNFRQRVTTAQRRGLIDDNFGYFGGEAFAGSGWRNFSAFFGAANVQALDWFTTLATQSYLWAYGCGGGNYTGAGGVGSTSNFKATDTEAVFTMLFGSYFGDWDTQDNFLRAPLATTTWGLTDAWSGRPVWHFHHMGLGAEVGYGALITENNSGLYMGAYGPATHIALMGDPTLRMHVVAPASALTAVPSGGAATLHWTASPDTVLGYNIYRSTSPRGPFTRVNGSLVTGLSYADSAVAALAAGTYTWGVRAVALESGTYYNASQAVFIDAAAGTGAMASDLEIELDAGPSPAVVGSTVTGRVVIANHGPADATGAQWTLSLPAGLSGVSVLPATGCTVTASLVTCNVGGLPRGGRGEYVVTVTASTAGTHTASAAISAVQSDPVAANNAASAPVSVVASAATTTLLSSSLNPSTVGQSVTLTATVTSAAGGQPAGSVSFRDGSTVLGTGALNAAGQATFATSTLALGARTITAAWAGDAHFAASTSAAVMQQVRANTTTTLTSSRNPAVLGAAIVWTAHVASTSGTPTGNVTFSDGGTTLGYVLVDASGNANFVPASLTVGTHSIVAGYIGDTAFNPSTSAALSQVVNAATGAATTATVASSHNPADAGQSVTLTSTVTSGTAGTITGSVSFVSGSIFLGTATVGGGGLASLTTTTIPAGVHPITAVYSGDATYNPSRSTNITQTVRGATTVALTTTLDPSGPGQMVTFTAIASFAGAYIGSPTGTMIFRDGSTTLSTLNVSSGYAFYSTAALAYGSHAITASYSGDSVFVASVSPVLTQAVGFLDVPSTSGFYPFVNTLARNGITSGCGNFDYCPNASATRAQMAVFLLTSKDGSAYTPPACSAPVFPDVPCSSPYAVWVNELSRRGVTSGCGGGQYCPNTAVTRGQMAVLLLRTKDGSTYTPPACTTAPFSDVPCSSTLAIWIQELVHRGITAGCGGGKYCPDSPVTRGQMAVFLVTTFSLT